MPLNRTIPTKHIGYEEHHLNKEEGGHYNQNKEIEGKERNAETFKTPRFHLPRKNGSCTNKKMPIIGFSTCQWVNHAYTRKQQYEARSFSQEGIIEFNNQEF